MCLQAVSSAECEWLVDFGLRFALELCWIGSGEFKCKQKTEEKVSQRNRIQLGHWCEKDEPLKYE